MQVFSQGIIGSFDTFLHPHYTVSVSPMDVNEAEFIVVFFIILIFGWALNTFHYYWKKAGDDECKDGERPP